MIYYQGLPWWQTGSNSRQRSGAMDNENSSQTAEQPAKAETEARRVEIDLRSALLYIIHGGGGYGIRRDDLLSRFQSSIYYVSGVMKYHGILVSAEQISAEINQLLEKGILVCNEKQWSTGGETTAFVSIANGVKLFAE
jgi:hypothetical protein